MSTEANPVTVRILEKDYKIACPPEEQSVLFRTADYVNQEMQTLKKAGQIFGTERVAVLAALNIARRLLEQGESGGMATADEEQIAARIDAFLAEVNQP